MADFFKRTWAQIDLDAAAKNYRAIRERLPEKSGICCVIKADAYGHGAVELAREYETLGAACLAVSNLEEAVQLRAAGINTSVLILGYTPSALASKLAEYEIAQCVFSLSQAKELSEFAAREQVTVRIHIKVDTGMTRIGFFYHDPEKDLSSLDEMAEACRLPNLIPEGIFTHFAVSDEGQDGEAFTAKQFSCFMRAQTELASRGICFPIRHCANSGAIEDYPETALDMVRAGIILYGLSPSDKVQHPLALTPVMELKSIISLVKTVEKDTFVSYGCTYKTTRTTRIATVPIGYADGYPRALSGKAQMLVRGIRAPIIGRVCMDQLMLDVTDIPGVSAGDTVTVFGRDGEAFLGVDELASLCGTINYELVCFLSKRVPRIYLRDNQMIATHNYICEDF